jgi:hypothetical protein
VTYLCMSDAEYELWLEASRLVRNGGRTPCVDCPMSYHLAMREQGRCDRFPVHVGRPIEPTPDAHRARRREQWRVAQRRRTAGAA